MLAQNSDPSDVITGRLLRETMGASTPAKVAGMAQSLITLRGQFDTGVAVQIATISFRIQTDVTTIREPCLVVLRLLRLCYQII